jgi:hypothetical protein
VHASATCGLPITAADDAARGAGAASIAVLAVDRVDAGDLESTLAWADRHDDDGVARASVLVGVVAVLLRPKRLAAYGQAAFRSVNALSARSASRDSR